MAEIVTDPTVNPDKTYPPIKVRIYNAYIAIVQIVVPSYKTNA